MKAIPWFFGLIVGLCLSSSSAFALSCVVSLDIPTVATSPEEKQLFDAQTRAQLGAYDIVAEAKVVGVGGIARTTWSSSQLVEVRVTRYLREPFAKQVDDRYHITVMPGSVRVYDELLFFANAEAEKTWRMRRVPLDPKQRERMFQIPRNWTERIWHAHGDCTNPVHQLVAVENEYLVQFARQLADDKLAPSSLRLSFYTGDLARNEIPVKITAIDRAQTSRTFTVAANGTDLDLLAGRYQLLWPEVPGFRAVCFAQNIRPSCELDLVPGASLSVQVEYQPTH